MNGPATPITVALLAAPEVTAATLYGFFDVLSATRRDWQLLHGGDAVDSPFRPLVVSRDGLPFTGANGVRITPDASLAGCPRPDVVCITDIAVVGARRGEVNKQVTSPCGVCRQALFEFGGPELNVIMAKSPDDFIERSMDELLPFGFGPSNVAGNKAVED